MSSEGLSEVDRKFFEADILLPSYDDQYDMKGKYVYADLQNIDRLLCLWRSVFYWNELLGRPNSLQL